MLIKKVSSFPDIKKIYILIIVLKFILIKKCFTLAKIKNVTRYKLI